MAVQETEDDQVRRATGSAPIEQPWLFLVAEGDRLLAGGARYALREVERVLLGRGDARGASREGRTLRVFLPGRTVSAVHARIVPMQGSMVVEDARSRNGTYVDGVRVVRAALGPSSVLEVGRACFVVTALPAATSVGDLDPAVAAPALPGLPSLRPELVERFGTLARVSTTDLSVLLLGETGVGKEVAAHGVHEASGRSGPFVAVHCGALVPELAEALLFGRAADDEVGFMRAAHRGTLFLDEVADLPPNAQKALLRALEAKEVVPVGATRPEPIDVRVIAATRSLDDAVARGAFRDDLRARLRGFEVTLPPLRARREDLGLLCAAILARGGGEPPAIAPDALRALLAYDWPHNVRELVQTLSAARAISGGGTIAAAHLPARVRAQGGPVVASRPADTLDEERLRAALIEQLGRQRGNVAAVARAMGKAPMQVHRWLKKLALDPSTFR